MVYAILPVMRANPHHQFGNFVVCFLQALKSSVVVTAVHAVPCEHYEASEGPWFGQTCFVWKLSAFACEDVFDAILEPAVDILDQIYEPLPRVSFFR